MLQSFSFIDNTARVSHTRKIKMWSEKYSDCLEYIDSYWDVVTHKPKKEVINHYVITIPNPYITPNPAWRGMWTVIFYWDTFFMFRGLIRTKREWLLESMVENFIYLLKTYGSIPNFNAPASMGRSQPPFLTSMILDTYNGYLYAHNNKNKFVKAFTPIEKHQTWLKRAVGFAKEEYERVWVDKDRMFYHSVDGYSLNRYGDRDVGYAHSSELESGWDFTSRYYNRCNEFLPIDLNVLLFKYERDFAKIAYHLKNQEEEKHWKKVAENRKKEINNLMWNEKKGFFFDYDYVNKKRSEFLSLAGFVPLWAGLANEYQAKRMVKMLKRFETDHGLVITAKESLAPQIGLGHIPEAYQHAIEDIIRPKQWDYPNSWPPLEYLTVIGLLKYGYIEDAKRIMEKYVKTHASMFRKYGTFFEKLNGVTGERATTYHYALQQGFGWTNAAFYRFIKILDSIDSGEEIYVQPKAKHPPYKLVIPH